ncbi:hypothetical protein [Saccharibacillus sp. O23]|uniref:hypothetical protein n=1 Tax=Saccharibacillus sp. O23 TaxID=2009338 RepID=UPI00117B3E1E|nr:hypothetical protein [Saccharibacillus sp. O23]
MKKILTAFISTSLIASGISPIISAQSINETSNDNTVVSSTSYNYNYNGLPVSSSNELTDSQLEQVYNQVKIIQSNGPGISVNSHDMGGAGMLVDGPVYKTFSNTTERVVLDAIFSWAASKVPFIKNPTKVQAWLFTTLQAFGLNAAVQPTYVGYWTTKSYNPNTGLYHYYLSVVRYTNNSFNKVISTQYGEIYADTK